MMCDSSWVDLRRWHDYRVLIRTQRSVHVTKSKMYRCRLRSGPTKPLLPPIQNQLLKPSRLRMSRSLQVVTSIDQSGDPAHASPALSPNIMAKDFPFNTKDCILFYSPDTEDLAHKVAAQGGPGVRLGEINWRWGAQIWASQCQGGLIKNDHDQMFELIAIWMATFRCSLWSVGLL